MLTFIPDDINKAVVIVRGRAVSPLGLFVWPLEFIWM